MRQLLMLTAALAAVSTASPAEVIDVTDNHGGRVDLYDHRWTGLAVGNPQVRVTGPCVSACTVLLKHVPRGKICVTPDASFGFHQALRPEMTTSLWNICRYSVARRIAWTQASGSSPFTWKMGMSSICATAVL